MIVDALIVLFATASVTGMAALGVLCFGWNWARPRFDTTPVRITAAFVQLASAIAATITPFYVQAQDLETFTAFVSAPNARLGIGAAVAYCMWQLVIIVGGWRASGDGHSRLNGT